MLETKQLFNEIIKSINQLNFNMDTPTTSKRSSNGETNPPKKQKTDEYEPINVIKHYIINKANWDLNPNQIQSLFKKIRIMVLDNEVDRNNNVVEHYHILGEAKFGQRKLRDMSLLNLRNADIRGGLEAKNFFMTARVKNIENAKHFINTVEYLKRKNSTLFEDESVTYGCFQNPIWKILDEAEEPAKFSKEDMAEFRRRFPLINSWKKVAAQKRLSKFAVKQLEEMEQQRKHEENIRELTNDEKHLLLPNMPILSHAKDLRTQLVNHDQNSGVCLILCGGALMCKSTINRIIASSFGEYAIWPGSQWIQRDPLKFDTAARQGISTIVVEEMQWIDVQHRITLDKTINSIKEQLTGAGLDVRLAKTKSNLQDDIKFKMEYLLISMNETEYVNYRTLSQLINSKPEYRRRFILINMDDPKYCDIPICRNRPNNNWLGNETQMEWLAGKALNNPEAIQELIQLDMERSIREDEIAGLVAFLDENPNIFDINVDPSIDFTNVPIKEEPQEDEDIIEMTQQEINEEMCKSILKDIINTIN